jgi:hypothetical protein
MLDQEIVIMDQSVYTNLPLGAIHMLIRIQQGLERNNPLWVCTNPNSRERSAIAALKQADILEIIAGTDFYIVNPAKIRRGHPLVVLGALYKYCKEQYEADKNWKLTTAAIRALTKRGAVDAVMLIDE